MTIYTDLLGPVDTSKTYSIVTVSSPVKLDWLRRAALAPGQYRLAGDWSTKIRRSKDWRYIQSGVVKVEVVEHDLLPQETVAPIAQPVAADTKPEATFEVAKPSVTEADPGDEPVVVEDDDAVEAKPIVPTETPKSIEVKSDSIEDGSIKPVVDGSKQ